MANTTQTEVSPIEEFVFNGLKSRLYEVFAAPVVMVNSTDEIQALKKLKEQGVTYPYLFLSITNLAETKDSYHNIALLRRGVDVLIQKDNVVAKKMSVLPVDFTFDVTYRHNKFPEVIEFGKMWLFAARAGYLKYSIEYGKAFDVHVYLSEEVQIPKREAGPENITEYSLLATLTVKGWMSSSKLREQQIATSVEVDAYLAALDGTQGVQFMQFKRTPAGSSETK